MNLLLVLLVSQVIPDFSLISTTTKELPSFSLVERKVKSKLEKLKKTEPRNVVTGDSLRAAGSQSLKDWLGKYGNRYPHVGISGMTAQFHLVEHHGFKRAVVERLSSREKALLHNAAHAIDGVPPRSFSSGASRGKGTFRLFRSGGT